LRIYGSEASAEWTQTNPEEVILSFADGHRQILDRASSVNITNLKRYNRFKSGHPAGFIEAFANLYADIADCLHDYKITGHWSSDEVFSAELAVEGLQFLEAMVQSSQSKKWQYVQTEIKEESYL
jgi:predicted dehydrogenase